MTSLDAGCDESARDIAPAGRGSVVFNAMDIVVRTTHGDADIAIVTHDAATTLGEVIEAVTGQAVPRLALVDGRAVDCATPLDDAGLVIGSIVTTEPTIDSPVSSTDVQIVQIAGHGAGRRTRLGPGRYRVGPGRRVHGDELAHGPVEHPALEVVVESTTTGSRTTIIPAGPDVELAGNLLTAPTRWTDEVVTIGPRAFRLESPGAPNPLPPDAERSTPVRRSRPDRHGIVPFSRAPRRRDAQPRSPVVDAVRDATERASSLWERRPDHADAYSLTFGVLTEPVDDSSPEPQVATVELGDGGGVAVVGSERFRSALARTLIIEAVTLHGPADLDLVVLTSSDRIADWEWAKWLPHLRLDGRPAIWSSPSDLTRWAQDPMPRSHLTFVVLDDPELWSRRGSPLGAMVTGSPGPRRWIALCEHAAEAPAVCSSMISETSSGLGRLQRFTSGRDLDGVRIALTEAATAERVARGLAPLDDIEVPTSEPASDHDDPTDLGELIGVHTTDDIRHRWTARQPSTTCAIGRGDHQPFEIPTDDDIVVIVGASLTDAFDVAATFILAQCTDRSPDALWIAPLALAQSDRSALLWSLPHATDPHEFTTSIDVRRLLARVQAVLADASGPDRVLIVLEERRLVASSLDGSMVTALADGARAIAGLGLLIVTDRPRHAGDDPAADTTIVVDPAMHTETHRRRSATRIDRDGHRSAPFATLARRKSSQTTLELHAATIGRPLSPLERRLEQRADASSTPDPSFAAIIERLRDAVAQQPTGEDRPRRTVVPTPLPTHIDLETLFADTPGDGVPVGRVDDPSTGGLAPRWWTPGDGSVLALGSRRSGVEQILSTIALGLIDRFAPDDVRLVVIEPSVTRRRALRSGDPAPTVRAPDRADEIRQTIDEIDNELNAELDRRADDGPQVHRPRLVVIVGDLAQLRGSTADIALVERLDATLAAAGPADSGVDVVAYSGDLSGAGPFAACAAHRIVGVSSAPADLTALGVLDIEELEGIVGRCRWFPDDDLVQLAMPDAVVETLLVRRSDGGAS
jgi:S-DNA-T family DNA segregation ATPase FtsK/SpoIIIE